MSELNLPTLALFNRAASFSKRPSLPKQERISYLHQLQQSNRIAKKLYVPPRSFAPYLQQQDERRNVRNLIQIDYLNTFTRTLNAQKHSGANSNYVVSGRSFGIATNEDYYKKGCECEDPHIQISVPERKIQRTVYFSNKHPPIYIEQQKQNPKNTVPNKLAYLTKKNGNQIVQPVKDIVIKPTIGANLSSDVAKSQFISEGTQKKQETPRNKQIKSQYQQTEEINNRSFFVKKREPEPDYKNGESFRKKINSLYTEELRNIDIMYLNQSEDTIVDLGDLVRTRDLYIEQSENHLSRLNALAQGKIKKGTSMSNDKVFWPSV